MKKTIARRKFLKQSAKAGALAYVGIQGFPAATFADDAIKIGSLLDTSGIFDAYGKPMDRALDVAIDEINEEGGLLGRKVEKVAYDTQSNMALYTQFVQKLVRSDKVDVVHGGILSASREAIRPTLHNRRVVYFYNVQYEGGVCDRNIVATGNTPAQQMEILMPNIVKRWGKKIYVLAADYNYGQITNKWAIHYAKKNGAEVIQSDFFPLDVSNFSTTIPKIQKASPDVVLSVLVGGAHLSFYRQWAAAGMKSKIPMASTTLGVGNEHLVLTPEEGNGILQTLNYSQTTDNPQNKAFLKRWKDKYGKTEDIHEIAASNYQGIKIWAQAVKNAGTLDYGKVIEQIESGLSIDTISGKVSIDPQTHHAVLDMHLMEVRDQKLKVLETFGGIQPSDTRNVCNLQKNPDSNVQHEL